MEKAFGLALSGGAALGIAHLGVLKCLQEKKIKISYLAGTSAGSIVAAALALGVPLDEMIDFAEDLSWFKLTALHIPKYGLLSTDMLIKRLKELLGDRTFEETKVPLAIVATDLSINQRVVIREGKILMAVAASCAIPGIFAPVRHAGKFLCDGGITENLPVKALEELGVQDIIAVDLNRKFMADKEPANIFEVIIRALNILILQNHQITNPNHTIITPELAKFNPLDINRVNELIEIGYESAAKVLKDQKTV